VKKLMKSLVITMLFVLPICFTTFCLIQGKNIQFYFLISSLFVLWIFIVFKYGDKYFIPITSAAMCGAIVAESIHLYPSLGFCKGLLASIICALWILSIALDFRTIPTPEDYAYHIYPENRLNKKVALTISFLAGILFFGSVYFMNLLGL